MGTLPAPPAALRSPGRPERAGDPPRIRRKRQGTQRAPGAKRGERQEVALEGNLFRGRGASPPGTSHWAPCSPGAGGLPAPPAPRAPNLPQPRGRRASCHRRPRAACREAPRAGRGARCGRPGANFPAGAPGPGPAAGHRAGSAAQTAGPRGRALGTAEGRAPEALPARGCAEPGAARASEPTTRAPGLSPVGPAAPGPGSPTAATVATRVSRAGRSPSEEKFPQWPRAAGTYSLSPLVGQSESAAEKNRSPHSEVGDPPPELDFIPFIWDEIPLSQKKKGGGWRRKRKSLRVFVSRPPPKTRAKATPLPEAAPAGGPRGGADGAGGGGGRPSAPAAAAPRSAESGTRGAPGRAVCVVGLHFQTQRGRREEKLRREGGQARIRLGEAKPTRPQTEGEAARRPSLRGGRARRSSQACPGARVAGEAGRGQKCGGKMNEPLPSSSSCRSSSAGLRSPPPPPPRAPSQIQDTHKAAGRPRSALPPPAPRRPPPAAGSARGLRLAEGQSRGAPWSSPRAGGAWRARGSASSRHGRAGARLPGGVPLPRPPLEFAWCARSSSGWLFFFFPSPPFFFFRSAELMLVNKSLSPAAPLPPPLPHTGARRARALGAAHTHSHARARTGAATAAAPARGGPGPGRRAPRAGAQELRDVRSGAPARAARRQGAAPAPRPRAPAPARARPCAHPHRTAPASLHARAPPARLQKQCPRRRALPGRGAGWGAGEGLGRAGRGARGPRGSLKTTTARLERALPRFLKSFIVSCSCCKINK